MKACIAIFQSSIVIWALLQSAWSGAADAAATDELAGVIGPATEFVRASFDASPDGLLGAQQPRLQTSLALLALLSLETPPATVDIARIEKGVAALLQAGSPAGYLGDDEFTTESHALGCLALLSALPSLTDTALQKEAAKRAYRAIGVLRRWQDRSSSSSARGGWKMAGARGRENDRRASAWALLTCRAAQLLGLPTKDADMTRAYTFMLGSYKETADNPDQIGGFSVDAEGLAVPSVSAMGGWFLQHLDPSSTRAEQNINWLVQHPPEWSGPNYFYTEFFRLRTLRRADPQGEAFARVYHRVFLQIRENQAANGAVAVPPGNAQNTAAMGPVFPTAMAILVLNIENSRLVCDEDYRVTPLFPRFTPDALTDVQSKPQGPLPLHVAALETGNTPCRPPPTLGDTPDQRPAGPACGDKNREHALPAPADLVSVEPQI